MTAKRVASAHKSQPPAPSVQAALMKIDACLHEAHELSCAIARQGAGSAAGTLRGLTLTIGLAIDKVGVALLQAASDEEAGK